jgi:cysteine desulfurase/selenocysteine lyase
LNVRADFPFLGRFVNDRALAYLDNAATTQKPLAVIERIVDLYGSGVSNVHRAVNFLAEETTEAFESARATIASFIHADPTEIAFCSNATHGINLISHALARKGPLRILTTTLEHHSNLLPWTTHGRVDVVPWDRAGHLDLDALRRKLSTKPSLVTVARASNFLGTLQPVREIVETCHASGVPVLVDASQSIAHELHDVSEIGCDFLVFSGHKIYGPGGIGVVYAAKSAIGDLQPLLVGGNMVKEVHADSHTLNDIPLRFEAGTPNIEGVIGLAAALDYVSDLGYEEIGRHEAALIDYAKRRLGEIEDVQLLGPPRGEACAPLVSFSVRGIESSIVAKVLANRTNVIVRSGFHCAQPAHDTLGIGPTVRASFAVYNTTEEIDLAAEVLSTIVRAVASRAG